ncbi:MAG: nodulation protein NfeD [Bdellovibrionales bacterium]|nr:nodulation protein NfeD [Bdellovibrionales bacterium]
MILAALALFAASAFGAEERVVHAEIRSTINPATAEYLADAIHFGEREKAQAVVISLDTPGGLVSSVEKMAQSIDRAKVPVVVYVEPAGASATSAGALLMLAAHVGAMTPGSHMGAAHPVDSSGKTIEGAMGEKVLNDTSSFAEGLAEIRGRNKALAAEIVRKSRSFTASEALAQKLVEVSADNLPDLLRKLDGRTVKFGAGGSDAKIATANATVEEFGMTVGQKLLNRISDPNIAAILMTLAMLLIYFELSHPGIQVAGILGLVCLVVAFMSFQTLPIRTGGIVLIVLGALGLFGEVFATSHGALAAGGTLAFVLGLVWVVDPDQIRMGVSPAVYVPAGIAMGGLALLIAWFASRTAETAAAARAEMKGGAAAGLAGYAGTVELAESAGDRSTGKVSIRGETWDFVAEGAPSLRAGDAVEVVRIEGLKAIVKLRKDT